MCPHTQTVESGQERLDSENLGQEMQQMDATGAHSDAALIEPNLYSKVQQREIGVVPSSYIKIRFLLRLLVSMLSQIANCRKQKRYLQCELFYFAK